MDSLWRRQRWMVLATVVGVAVVASAAWAADGGTTAGSYQVDWFEMLRNPKRSFSLWILTFCAVMVAAYAVERLWFYRSARVDPKKLIRDVKDAWRDGGPEEAMAVCERAQAPLGNVLRVAIRDRAHPEQVWQEFVDAAKLEQRIRLERRLPLFGSMASSAPFIGLLGTVVGIMTAMIRMSEGASKSEMYGTIGEALIATAAGMVVAIPAVLFYNFFLTKVKAINNDFEIAERLLIPILKSPPAVEGGAKRRKTAEDEE